MRDGPRLQRVHLAVFASVTAKSTARDHDRGGAHSPKRRCVGRARDRDIDAQVGEANITYGLPMQHSPMANFHQVPQGRRTCSAPSSPTSSAPLERPRPTSCAEALNRTYIYEVLAEAKWQEEVAASASRLWLCASRCPARTLRRQAASGTNSTDARKCFADHALACLPSQWPAGQAAKLVP